MIAKLIAPPYTTDYAVLFLESEGLYAEVLRIAGLSERVQQESHMVIAGPTTLAALISSLQLGFKSLAIEQRTQEVMNLLGAIRTDFAGFASLLWPHRKSSNRRQRNWITRSNTHRRLRGAVRCQRSAGKRGKKLLGVMDEDDDDNWD